MTGAYAGILNGGSSVIALRPRGAALKGEDEPLIGAGGGMGERVISESAAQELIYMMTEVVKSGTGTRARLDDREAAGKTGTTQAARDAWFIGFTADYVAGVWMGYDDNQPLKGVTGGGLPAEIWHEVMVRVHEGLPANPLPMYIPEPRQTPAPVPLPGQETPAAAVRRKPDRRLRQHDHRCAERDLRRRQLALAKRIGAKPLTPRRAGPA